ncbi:phosphatase PAP2 family protein [Methylocapsa sp. S129]|uniref:acid phosphatase n=1 Tax=Methylocapsa sp. S129 TaxID=1641869 RepID=UPI00131B30CB|nr:phosphatase PAP2 family protein [Methylocapsa sp. S129]
MLRLFFCTLAVGAALSSAAAAQEESHASLHFLSAGQVDLTKILPAPPKLGSKAQNKDMAISLAWQARRTPAMIALAQADSDRSVFRFGVILGDSFAKDRLPLTVHFFDEVAGDERLVGAAAKTYWDRPRPFVTSARIHPCVDQPPTNSYPSNHATIGMLYAQILARMLPEQRLRILARAQQYAQDRVICGVHYTSDIEAGKRAGAIEAFAMFRDPAFKKEFAEAKAEIRSALSPAR